MTDDTLRWLLAILERRQRHYDARMRDREAAAKLAAIANLPVGVDAGEGVVPSLAGYLPRAAWWQNAAS